MARRVKETQKFRLPKRLLFWLRGQPYDPLIDGGRRIRLVPPAHLLAGISASMEGHFAGPRADPPGMTLSAASPRSGSGKKRSGAPKHKPKAPPEANPSLPVQSSSAPQAPEGVHPSGNETLPLPLAGAAPGEASPEDGEAPQQNGYNGYRHFLTPEERDDARRTQDLPITVEINIFRVQLKKMLRLAAEISSLDEMVQFTNSYGLALLRISRLLEAEQGRGAGTDDIQAQLPEIIKKVNEELDHELNQQLPLFR